MYAYKVTFKLNSVNVQSDKYVIAENVEAAIKQATTYLLSKEKDLARVIGVVEMGDSV